MEGDSVNSLPIGKNKKINPSVRLFVCRSCQVVLISAQLEQRSRLWLRGLMADSYCCSPEAKCKMKMKVITNLSSQLKLLSALTGKEKRDGSLTLLSEEEFPKFWMDIPVQDKNLAHCKGYFDAAFCG